MAEITCPHCKTKVHLRRSVQTFKNNTQHLRVDCDRCGVFVGYDKQGPSSFKEEMFHFVRAVSEAAVTAENMDFFRNQARKIMGKATNGV